MAIALVPIKRQQKEERVMANQNSVVLEFENRNRQIVPSEMQAKTGWMKKTLLRLMALLSGRIRGRNRFQTTAGYLPRNSREKESRLEFERFIHW
jgi:hypothetical protein